MGAMMTKAKSTVLFGLALTFLTLTVAVARSQERAGRGRGPAKPVTIPLTILVPKPEVEMRTVDLILKEDGDLQQILAIRPPSENPITVAFLIQDDLDSSVGSEIKGIADLVRHQPGGARVMIGYIRAGSLEVRRRFTEDTGRAAKSLRIPLGSVNASPYNPFVEVIEALRRFDSQPLGRRALFLVSDGLDVSRGVDSSAPGQSLDLQRAINEAQRRSVAIYSIYVPSAAAASNPFLGANGQGCLDRLSNETGGKAFFQGSGAPVSFDPFLREIDDLMSRQIALTYLSSHTSKGFHRLDIKPLERNAEIRHPAGFFR